MKKLHENQNKKPIFLTLLIYFEKLYQQKKAGAVTGSIVAMFEVYQATNADMNLNAFVDDDGNMFVHAIGHAFPLGYIVASNIIFGRGDTAPNVDIPGCDTNLVGTWKSIDDIDRYNS